MRVALTLGKPHKIPPYEHAMRLVGLEPVRVSPAEPRNLNGLAGLVLTGGSDIDPARYGKDPEGSLRIDVERDRLEIDLLAEALAAGLPVLAICRGVQLLNVAHGGSLIQHLGSCEVHDKRSPEWEMGRHPAAHAVDVATGSRLAGIIR